MTPDTQTTPDEKAASIDKKTKKRLTKELRAAQQKHEELLVRVTAAREKFEKRMQKLHELEVDIGGLEHALYTRADSRLGQSPNQKNLRDAYLIYNPKSASNGKDDHKLDKIIEMLRAHGIRAEVGIKTSGKAVREMAKNAADHGHDLIIIAGGDGTIEDVASQVIGSSVTLAILPAGTMNNIARSLGVPLDMDAACALIGMGTTRKIDIGRVIVDESPQVEYFLESAGMGLSAVALPMGQAAKNRTWAELPHAFRRLFEIKPLPIAIELDSGELIQSHSQLVTVSNAPLIGTNLLMAPDAKMDDGWLDLSVYDDMTKSDLLGYFMNVSIGKKSDDPRIKRYRVQHVKIHTGHAAPVVSDKDAVPERREMEIQIIPHGLTMIVGDGIGLSLPVQSVPKKVDDTQAAIKAEIAVQQPVVVGELAQRGTNGGQTS